MNIFLHKKTIQNIIKYFWRKGKIKKSLSWRKFLSANINSLFAMDFFTVDTILKQRFYVFFIICHKTREIVQFAVNKNPTREFARQQIIEFENNINRFVYLIRDNMSSFNLDYLSFNIKDIRTAVGAPKMNAIAERFVGSVRREALDNFIILSEKQLFFVLREYVDYYNSLRPHQGIDQNVPKGYVPLKDGKILKKPVLSGLHHHYFPEVA